MKKITKFILALIFIVPIMFSGCQKTEIEEEIKNMDDSIPLKSSEICGDPMIGTLTDWEQTVNVGSLSIENDESKLYITFEAGSDYRFSSTYLYVGPADGVPGDLFPNNTGDFAPWAFPLFQWFWQGTTQHTFELGLDTLDNCFIVVAYSNVQNINTLEEHIVYGKGNTKSLGFYVDYCKQTCETAPPLGCPKLAFAHDDATAICFKDIKRNGNINPNGNGTWSNFMLWGWTNGELAVGTYEMDLWAGSNGCDPSNGILVGTVIIAYNGSSADVTYNVNPAYVLKSTYLYVGDKILPKVWHKYRVAPLFYPNKHYQVNASDDSYTINNLSGDIYIAASAIVQDAE